MIPRHITPFILEALSDSPVVLLNGARQTGKSTLVQWVASQKHKARYLTLDDAAVLAAARSDAGGFLSGIDGPVVIDEIQRAPELFPAIKADVDRRRQPGRFLLTGSADVLLLPQISESLAGRMEILTLWPFSQGETAEIKETFIDDVFSRTLMRPSGKDAVNRSALWRLVLRGGYPEILNRADVSRRDAWFSSYVATILQRDVRDIANIEGLTALPRLLALLAARASSLVNFSELSRSIAIPQSTLKRYLALLEMTFLVQMLPPWSGNLSKRLVKAPKLLISDAGLTAYLLGLNQNQLEQNSVMAGPLLENFVVMELKKQSAWNKTRVRLFHFRTQNGQEVDIILEDRAGRMAGIEVKAASTVGADDFRGLRALQETAGRKFFRGVILYTGSEVLSFGAGLHALPIGVLWRGSQKHIMPEIQLQSHRRMVK